MTEAHETRQRSVLEQVSNAMVRLHKEQFGRGPTRSRSYFAGPDMVVCVLREALLPADLRMVALGQQERVRDSRSSFQAATEAEFVAAVEEILSREVVAFASGVDPNHDYVFENFCLAPEGASGADSG